MARAKPSKSASKKNNSQTVTSETARQLALAFPEAVEGTSYGTAAFRVRGKLFARMHQSGESVVVKIDIRDRARRMKADPESFYITDHYLNYPLMLVRFSTVTLEDLRELLEESWRSSAPTRLVAEFEASRQMRTDG